jgi:hypothetical protein
LEKRAEQVLPGSKGEEREGWGQEGEMAQTMYANTDKCINYKKKRLTRQWTIYLKKLRNL